jgi:hypothetical protein
MYGEEKILCEKKEHLLWENSRKILFCVEKRGKNFKLYVACTYRKYSSHFMTGQWTVDTDSDSWILKWTNS